MQNKYYVCERSQAKSCIHAAHLGFQEGQPASAAGEHNSQCKINIMCVYVLRPSLVFMLHAQASRMDSQPQQEEKITLSAK